MKNRLFHSSSAGQGSQTAARAFTVMELMIVIAIIAILAAISLPRLRGLGESNAMKAGTKQLLDDLKFARQKAISGRTTVAVMFVSSDVASINPNNAAYDAKEAAQIKRLQGGIYTQYALFSFRDLGEQPGRSSPHYLTAWRTLPDKIFVPDGKFTTGTADGIDPFDTVRFPFPFTRSKNQELPCIAFDYEGRLFNLDNQGQGGGSLHTGNITIPLARGAIFYTRDAADVVTGFDAQEIPPNNSIDNYNHIVIDWLTGRAKLERADIIK